MENNDKVFAKSLIDINLFMTNKLEGFNLENKHKNINIDMEFKILHLLENYGRLTPMELVEKMCVAKSNLSNQCKLMMQNDLIKQFGDKNDKRVICYSLCQKGKEKYDNTLKEIINNFNNLNIEDDLTKIREEIIKLGLLLN